jgi:beta-xylosidase
MARLTLLGRETFLTAVEWDNDWPVLNRGEKITIQSVGPGLYEHAIPVFWRDDFVSPKLQLGWYRKSKTIGDARRSWLNSMQTRPSRSTTR